MNATKLSLVLPTLALVASIAACTSATSPSATPGLPSPTPGSTPAPAVTPQPTPAPTAQAGQVTSAAQAAALVFASNPLFSSMIPLQPELIGQSAWYEASQTADGFSVVVTMGSGDCQAG